MNKNIITKISDTFLKEARMSPKMLEDLALMERYMAESYDGRSFIELLQNADDAKSTNIIVRNIEDTVIVANNGREFDENDIYAICRSGASTKQRGSSIGYRGVGFKTATTISSEIVIHSSDIFFTFSKNICSERLGVNQNQVPTIRIPFIYDVNLISKEVLNAIELYKTKGYTTFFIFNDANTSKFVSELKEINNGWILFLNNIERVSIILDEFSYCCDVSRQALKVKQNMVEFKENNEKWLIVKSDNNTSLGFKYNDEIGIVPCEANEALFHCYLPTLDSTGFGFKVNGDFSTDPSRKHIIKDSLTDNVLEDIFVLFGEFIKNAAKDDNYKTSKSINLLTKHLSLNDLSIILEKGIISELKNIRCVKLQSNELVYPNEVRSFPKWINSASIAILCEKVEAFRMNKISSYLYDNLDDINKILQKLGSKEYELVMFTRFLESKENLKLTSNYLWENILVNLIKFSIASSDININNCLVILEDGNIKTLHSCEEKDVLSKPLINKINENLSLDEVERFCNIFNISIKLFKKYNNNTSNLISNNDIFNKFSTKTSITKWRTAEQNCVLVEESFGNKAKDVSKKNLGYDILSETSDGKIRYVEVKYLKRLGDSFTITNNEYTAAHQYKDKYYICLMTQDKDLVEVVYINNPIETLNFEKRARAWEWLCDEYTGNQIKLSILSTFK